ncbi:hypothetical protein TWF481_001784 [Arthrobotrys musiformis]|uniref:Uncharacterized protein n=1 Tax=Arthrobotrys musiformis TaxID=47236 RepID=A0AAV9VW34_9PEZI
MATFGDNRSQHLTEFLDYQTTAYFEMFCLFKPAFGNKREISTFILSPFISSSASPPTGAQMFTPTHLANGMGKFNAASLFESKKTIEIPLYLESVETLEMIGFCPQQAELIMGFWWALLEGTQISFLELVLDCIDEPTDSFQDSFGPDDDWERSLNQLGISDKLKAAILMPQYEDIRYTASCLFWVKEAVVENYHALVALKSELAERANHLKSLNFTGGLLTYSTIPKNQDDKQDTQDAAQSDSPATKKPWTTKFYRASGLERAMAFYNETTGKIDNDAFAIASGDFGSNSLTYWTTQKEVADKYACWKKHKSPLCRTIITEVEVTAEFLSQLRPTYLQGFEDGKIVQDFQQFTFLSRHSVASYGLPEHLRHITETDMTIGHILKYPKSHRQPLPRSGWKNITTSDLLGIQINGGERMAIQWAFRSQKARKMFNAQSRGKVVQYDVFRFTF